jgi:hypothetical protein
MNTSADSYQKNMNKFEGFWMCNLRVGADQVKEWNEKMQEL